MTPGCPASAARTLPSACLRARHTGTVPCAWGGPRARIARAAGNVWQHSIPNGGDRKARYSAGSATQPWRVGSPAMPCVGDLFPVCWCAPSKGSSVRPAGRAPAHRHTSPSRWPASPPGRCLSPHCVRPHLHPPPALLHAGPGSRNSEIPGANLSAIGCRSC